MIPLIILLAVLAILLFGSINTRMHERDTLEYVKGNRGLYDEDIARDYIVKQLKAGLEGYRTYIDSGKEISRITIK